MQKNNETLPIGLLIKSSVFAQSLNDTKLQSVIKHSTIFSFWGEIAGKKFEKISIPYLIKGSVFYVSARSPVIIQELSLYKDILIKKINSYSMPLGIEIKKISFSYKNYDEIVANNIPQNYPEDETVWYNQNDLDKVELELDKKISAAINNIKFLSDEQKKELIYKINSNYKAQYLRKNTSIV